jgi:hypothetical protein
MFLLSGSGEEVSNSASASGELRPLYKLGLALLLLTFALERLAATKADPDLWGYLTFGRLFWTSHHFPYHDIFSFLPTLPRWVYHEWLTGVLFYPLYQAFGAAGLQGLKFALGLATLGLVYLAARRLKAGFLAAIVGLFLIQGLLTMGYSPVRAQVFTYALYALTLYVLETARQAGSWRILWVLVPVQIFWCNVHGGFLAGLGLVGIYALGEALSRRPFWPYAGILLLAGLATLINPYGLEYWQYLLQAIMMPRPEIVEWASLLQTYRAGMDRGEILYISCVVLIFALLAWRARWRDLTPILALGVTLYLGIRHTRHLVFFLLLTGAYLPVVLTGFFAKLASEPQLISLGRRLGWKVPLVAGLVLVASYGATIASRHPLSLTVPPLPDAANPAAIYYPVGAVDYLKRHHAAGNLLTEFVWGEYLIWNLFPQCKVALDGRYETVYSEKLANQYFDFMDGGKNWREFLEKYPVDMVLINRNRKLYPLMLAEKPWRQVYRDQGCALFIKQP